ncbi:MAG: hypothetical protein IJK58_00455 [Clostridia bacterium]|nr:hypothetical protein [Clostridia bacterium]
MATDNTEKRPDPKRRINVSDRIKNENPYYIKISDRYRAAGFLLIVLFAVFAGIMLFRFGENITYDNLVYLARDFNTAMGTNQGSITEVRFTEQDEMTFVPFRDGVAAAGSNDVFLIGPSGDTEFSYSENYTFPVLNAGEKYLLAYSPGGRNYSIYSSVTRLSSKETEGEIVSADMSDSGAYVIVFRTSSGKYDVEIYGDSFKRIMTVHKDKHVIDSAISSDGKRVAVVSAVEGDLDVSAELYVVRAGDSEPFFRKTVASSVPLVADYLPSGILFVIYDDRIEFYDETMEILYSEDLSGTPPSCYGVSGSGVVVCCRENALGTKNRIRSFDSEGNVVYNESISSGVLEVAAPSGDNGVVCYVRTPSEIVRISANGEVESASYTGDAVRIVDTSGGLLLCRNGSVANVFGATERKE